MRNDKRETLFISKNNQQSSEKSNLKGTISLDFFMFNNWIFQRHC